MTPPKEKEMRKQPKRSVTWLARVCRATVLQPCDISLARWRVGLLLLQVFRASEGATVVLPCAAQWCIFHSLETGRTLCGFDHIGYMNLKNRCPCPFQGDGWARVLNQLLAILAFRIILKGAFVMKK